MFFLSKIYRRPSFIILIAAFLFASCTGQQNKQNTTYSFDLQGHRGCRGLMPENSLAAFEKALELGVTTLELDLAVSADSQLVVSHEPWFSASICTDSLGNAIGEEEEKSLNIHAHTYQQVALYDCGSIGNPRFPEQQKMAQQKPLLKDVVAFVKKYTADKNQDLPNFNIEIKSSPEGDGIYHPSPAVFSDLLHNFLQENLPKAKVTVQSFDVRVLQYWNQKYPDYTLAYLVWEENTVEGHLQILGFTPAIYSPAYQLLDEEKVKKLHEMNMQVIPWTVNETEEMEKLLAMGVDGIITDYPDRALGFKGE